MGEHHGEAERHALQHECIQRPGHPGVLSPGQQRVGQCCRSKGDGDHEEEQQKVREEQHAVHVGELPEERVVVHPHDADHEEAHNVGRERRPLMGQLVEQRAISWSGHRQVQGEQGDGHCEHSVAERLDPAAVHHTTSVRFVGAPGA